MGWEMPWYTITDSFDKDFGVDEWHGHNVFFRDGERVFRTYFINNRGDEAMGTIWSYLDITPLGRQETWEDSPEGYPQDSAVQVVELARQLRGRGHASPEVGRYNYRPSRSRLPKARRRGESELKMAVVVVGITVERLFRASERVAQAIRPSFDRSSAWCGHVDDVLGDSVRRERRECQPHRGLHPLSLGACSRKHRQRCQCVGLHAMKR